ncbi:MAG: hypothetical protein WBO70_00385 [Erysipelotrichaceae bacterium]
MGRKEVNFDLDTKKLKEYYDSYNWKNAYRDIRQFMVNNGFDHRQGSGYISVKSMTYYDVEAKLYEAYYNMSWLKNCVKTLDVTSVSKNYDIVEKFKDIEFTKYELYKDGLNELNNENKVNDLEEDEIEM